MSELMREWAADRIGIGEPPYFDKEGVIDWPTYGYDGSPPYQDGDVRDEDYYGPAFTRTEWLWLADEMVARWQAFKAEVATAPDSEFVSDV